MVAAANLKTKCSGELLITLLNSLLFLFLFIILEFTFLQETSDNKRTTIYHSLCTPYGPGLWDH